MSPLSEIRVRDLMSREPETIAPDAPLGAALAAMRAQEIRHLPVVEPGGRLVGIVTDRDLRQAMLARSHALRDANRDLQVQDVMTCGVVTVEPDATVVRAATLMHERKIGSVPVVEGGRLAGIVTERDLLRAVMRESPARATAVEPFLW